MGTKGLQSASNPPQKPPSLPTVDDPFAKLVTRLLRDIPTMPSDLILKGFEAD